MCLHCIPTHHVEGGEAQRVLVFGHFNELSRQRIFVQVSHVFVSAVDLHVEAPVVVITQP